MNDFELTWGKYICYPVKSIGWGKEEKLNTGIEGQKFKLEGNQTKYGEHEY